MEKLYTCAEIADRYSVPVGTVWRWIRRKMIPAINLGKEYRISEIDLKQFEKERKTV